MRGVILAIVMLLLAIEAADARKRRHDYRYYHQPAQVLVVPPEAHGSAERFNRRALRRGSAVVPLATLIPPGWQPQAPDPGWNGKRFVSPDGSSWFAVYKSSVDRPVSEHMKVVVFATDDETLTHVRGERSWIEVSGFKAGRIFYRKAIVAC